MPVHASASTIRKDAYVKLSCQQEATKMSHYCIDTCVEENTICQGACQMAKREMAQCIMER